MTEPTSTSGKQPIRLVPLTKNEWEIVDFYRQMSDSRKDALLRFGYAMAVADGGHDHQGDALEGSNLDEEQEGLEALNELRLLPKDERKSAIQALRDLLAKAEQEFVESVTS
ncbi:hypothetical protein NS274_07600 [Pseudomonas oryzihabitans]|nr:hypothetical protein NS274_07600 [Pseudomonas psychrotolerans]